MYLWFATIFGYTDPNIALHGIPVQNRFFAIGGFGNNFANFNVNMFGYLAYIYLPLLLLPVYKFHDDSNYSFQKIRLTFAYILLFIACLIFQAVIFDSGMFGTLIQDALQPYIGIFGVFILASLLMMFALLMISRSAWEFVFKYVGGTLQMALKSLRTTFVRILRKLKASYADLNLDYLQRAKNKMLNQEYSEIFTNSKNKHIFHEPLIEKPLDEYPRVMKEQNKESRIDSVDSMHTGDSYATDDSAMPPLGAIREVIAESGDAPLSFKVNKGDNTIKDSSQFQLKINMNAKNKHDSVLEYLQYSSNDEGRFTHIPRTQVSNTANDEDMLRRFQKANAHIPFVKKHVFQADEGKKEQQATFTLKLAEESPNPLESFVRVQNSKKDSINQDWLSESPRIHPNITPKTVNVTKQENELQIKTNKNANSYNESAMHYKIDTLQYKQEEYMPRTQQQASEHFEPQHFQLNKPSSVKISSQDSAIKTHANNQALQTSLYIQEERKESNNEIPQEIALELQVQKEKPKNDVPKFQYSNMPLQSNYKTFDMSFTQEDSKKRSSKESQLQNSSFALEGQAGHNDVLPDVYDLIAPINEQSYDEYKERNNTLEQSDFLQSDLMQGDLTQDVLLRSDLVQKDLSAQEDSLKNISSTKEQSHITTEIKDVFSRDATLNESVGAIIKENNIESNSLLLQEDVSRDLDITDTSVISHSTNKESQSFQDIHQELQNTNFSGFIAESNNKSMDDEKIQLHNIPLQGTLLKEVSKETLSQEILLQEIHDDIRKQSSTESYNQVQKNIDMQAKDSLSLTALSPSSQIQEENQALQSQTNQALQMQDLQASKQQEQVSYSVFSNQMSSAILHDTSTKTFASMPNTGSQKLGNYVMPNDLLSPSQDYKQTKEHVQDDSVYSLQNTVFSQDTQGSVDSNMHDGKQNKIYENEIITNTTHDTPLDYNAIKKPTIINPPSLNEDANMHNNEVAFRLPPLTLLQEPVPQVSIQDEELDSKIEKMFQTLNAHKIKGDIVSVFTGPVVTTFEFRPETHVKVSKVLSHRNDLALGLKAKSIRIQAPIPGKDVIGIEIPNNKVETIYLREILQSNAFLHASDPLTIALGKNIMGEPVTANLAKLPHLLVAGTTGSGKSVGVNAIILSLLYRNNPDNLKLMMIDPKQVEFAPYEDLPHLITPIINAPNKAIKALQAATIEMDKRYELFSQIKAKNIISYNEKATVKMSNFVIIIDELADLMITGGKEAEAFIARIAQMGRAAGMHLIIATQRSSVNVVTGYIKANLPSRISYRVGSRVDSKVILDDSGAEELLGNGDGLFTTTNGLIRIHAPWVSEQEVENIVDFIKAQRKPEYDESFLSESKTGVNMGDKFVGEGGILDEAKAIILKDNKTSISNLQRKMGIGYNKAASLIEALEEEGFLSSPNTKGERHILH